MAANNENSKVMEILNEMYGTICYQRTDGKMYLAGSSILLESTILDSRTFIRALECFVESVIDGNAYDALSSLTFICTDPRFQKDLNAFIKAFVSSKEVCIPSDYDKWTFDDALISYVWGQPSFNKLPAIFLYGMVTAISDTGFDVKINNYGGDIAHLSTITYNFAPLFRWDYDVKSKAGTLVPYAKLYEGGYLSDFHEPCKGRDELDKLYEEYKQMNSIVEVEFAKSAMQCECVCTDITEHPAHSNSNKKKTK